MAFSEAFNTDCMELMKHIPDKFVDIALVDPPYGLGMDKQMVKLNGKVPKTPKQRKDKRGLIYAKNSTFDKPDWDSEPPPPEYFTELFRVSKNQIIFGANHFIERIPINSSCWVVWDKCNDGTDYADCELAWTSFNCSVKKFTYRWNGFMQGNLVNGRDSHLREKRIHSTQKPVDLYRQILSFFAKSGDTILDTHLGSGSHRIAANMLNLDFISSEIDTNMFNKQELRFKTSLIKQELPFAKPIVEQQKLML